MAKLRIAEWQKLIGKQGRDNSIQQFSIYNCIFPNNKKIM